MGSTCTGWSRECPCAWAREEHLGTYNVGAKASVALVRCPRGCWLQFRFGTDVAGTVPHPGQTVFRQPDFSMGFIHLCPSKGG